ncbi:MAG TPA: hypothetical protein VGM06_15765 [Polyangiaceae bacterium]|jgi:hypothetical protein
MAADRNLLADDDELLFRQVHPTFVRDGRPSSQAFRPTAKDERKLSVARGSITTAATAFQHHTERLGLPSGGTWGVTVGECREQGLPAFSDPVTAPPEKVADPAHAIIDFTTHSRNQVDAKGARLARTAFERGRLHPFAESV